MLHKNPHYEAPQPDGERKNPRGFTIKQHVFPRSRIAKFCNERGRVQAHLLAHNRVIGARPDDELFCARRVWDQSAERGFVADIETPFARLVDRLIAGNAQSLVGEEHGLATSAYSLWCRRFELRKHPPAPAEMRGVLPERGLTKTDQETLEMNGYAFAVGTAFPSRIWAGMRVKFGVLHDRRMWDRATWGVLRSHEAEFLVPDNVVGLGLVPVAPNLCLYMGEENREINPLEVGYVNRIHVDNADQYYFARDLNRCPILRRTIPR